MRAGDLWAKVTIQRKVTTSDPEGMATVTWQDVATVRANVRGLKGREFFQAAAVNAEGTIVVTIRWWPGVTPEMRLKYTAPDQVEHILDIYNVNPLGRKQWLELMCREVVAGGGAV